MSAIIAVDATSGIWFQVVEYCNKRVEELTETCVSPHSSHEQRAEAAYRIAELRELVAAPKRARGVTEHRRQFNTMDTEGF